PRTSLQPATGEILSPHSTLATHSAPSPTATRLPFSLDFDGTVRGQVLGPTAIATLRRVLAQHRGRLGRLGLARMVCAA
ncbi:MAG: hypothetical protein AB1486_32375, partial [Planctomycetota bacterium]